jgi:hypothetical protein
MRKQALKESSVLAILISCITLRKSPFTEETNGRKPA